MHLANRFEEKIANTILLIRGQRVMLDMDLAELYGVSTKALNQAVKRNRTRFPKDFMFRLTQKEKSEVVTICDHLKKLKFSPHLPCAFTEHGALMLASVLNSKCAVEMSLLIVRIFIKFRGMLSAHQELARQIVRLEKKSRSMMLKSKRCLKPFVSLLQLPKSQDEK